MLFLILFIMLLVNFVSFSLMRAFQCDLWQTITNISILSCSFLIPLSCSMFYSILVEQTIVLDVVLTGLTLVFFNVFYTTYKNP